MAGFLGGRKARGIILPLIAKTGEKARGAAELWFGPILEMQTGHTLKVNYISSEKECSVIEA
jgi:predicted secreted Zn-dependent protease